MGNKQTTTVNILVQDDEFDDVFTKYWLNKSFPSTDWLEYIVGGSEKFYGDVLSAKNTLARSMGYDRSLTPRLLTNGDGTIKKATGEYVSFVESVHTDLLPFHDTDGFNIQIVLTGQCAPFVRIMSEFMNGDDTTTPYLTPANVEVVVVNGKHNGQKLFKALLELTSVCKEHNIGLVVREFNAFSSMGEGAKQWVELAEGKKFVECGTSEAFNQKVYDSVQTGNVFAKGVIQYGVKFNSYLVAKAVPKIHEAVKTLSEIHPEETKSWNLQTVEDDVKLYILDLINVDDNDNEFLGLDVGVCQQLSKDLNKIVQCTNSLLKRVAEDLESGLITKAVADGHKKKLYRIRGWFKVKAAITKSDLVQFPFHDLASVIITTQGDALTPVDAWAIEFGEFMNIVNDKPADDVASFPVVHYVANDPESTRQVIEDLIFKAIEENA
jgi:hypothetical protein